MTAGNHLAVSSSHSQAYGLRRSMVLGQPLRSGSLHLRLVPEVPLPRPSHPPLHTSPPPRPRRRLRQFRSFGAVIDKGTLDSLLCGHDSRHNAVKMLEEVWRLHMDYHYYSVCTLDQEQGQGDQKQLIQVPLLKDLSWTTKLHVTEKLPLGNSSDQTATELTSPTPLDVNESSAETVAGVKADVHYIHVCNKGNAGKSEAKSPAEG